MWPGYVGLWIVCRRCGQATLISLQPFKSLPMPLNRCAAPLLAFFAFPQSLPLITPPPPPLLYTDSLRIIFRSSPSDNFPGFQAAVTCIDPKDLDDANCSDPITSTEGAKRNRNRNSI